ncbi:MAG: CysB family HTH-type transcriptional regulator [Trinickia sp.]|jgi:LysR family cys regulon transcriptional activator|uniref:CysB family HTH-type transcriptional regulator n=1 Tax=Trinickia sp. TaxID=2571163 RepID=UPI003F7E5614
MNFQQLRYVREAVRRNLNLTEVANVLFASQSGVSKQIKDLEDELGVDIFVRRGKRLTGLTEPGKAVHRLIERMLLDAENLRRVARQYADEDTGHLVVATTHTQARYALPPVIRQFKEAFPKVHLALRQGSPRQIGQMLVDGEADIAIATEGLDSYADILTFPCYTWHHVIVVPKDHPLATRTNVTLEEVADFPIITYERDITGRSHIDEAFEKTGQLPDVVLTAIDADVIKTYVELGMGVGIVAAMAYDSKRDTGLVALDSQHLFAASTTRVGVRKGAILRAYAYRLIEMFAPELAGTDITGKLREAA